MNIFKNKQMTEAIKNNDIQTVECLLSDHEIVPSRNFNHFLRLAATHGQLEITALFFKHEDFNHKDLNFYFTNMLNEIVSQKNVPMLNLILSEDRTVEGLSDIIIIGYKNHMEKIIHDNIQDF